MSGLLSTKHLFGINGSLSQHLFVTAETIHFCPKSKMSWHFFVLSVFRTRIRSSKSYGGFVTDYLSITVLTSGRCEHLLAQLLCTSKPINLNSNPGVLFLAKFSEIYKNTSYFMQQWLCISGILRLIHYWLSGNSDAQNPSTYGLCAALCCTFQS